MALEVKVDYFFRQGIYGWMETYWRLNDATLAASLAAAEAMAPFRSQLLNDEAKLLTVRVSDQSENLDSLVSKKEFFSGKDYIGMPGEREYTALKVRQSAPGGFGRTIYMRGLPKGLVLPAPAGDATSLAFERDFALWVVNNFVPGKVWRMRSLIRIAGFVKVPAVGVSDSGVPDGAVKITLPINVPAGVKAVRLSGFKAADFPGNTINGIWQPRNIAGATFTIALPWNALFVYSGGGNVRFHEYNYPSITRSVPAGLARRKTGRSYGMRRGRLLNRK